MVDQDRREAIKRIVRGAAYTAPVVLTMGIPNRALAQGPSGMGMGMMMLTFCDFFPILCMIFGGVRQAPTPGLPPGTPTPGVIPGAPGQAPGFTPSPGQRPPPGGG